MTCIKITESQNGQIYPEDTFSHGAALLYWQLLIILFADDRVKKIWNYTS